MIGRCLSLKAASLRTVNRYGYKKLRTKTLPEHQQNAVELLVAGAAIIFPFAIGKGAQ
jgi:hypothetical protein